MRIPAFITANRGVVSLPICFLFLLLHSAFAQTVLLPGKVEAHEIEGGKTQGYSLELKDGDYVGISISQHGKLNITVLRSDGSVMRRFPELVADVNSQYAFAAEGSGTYFINVANPGEQSVKYELLLNKVLSLDERLQTSTAWIDPNPSPRIEALRQQVVHDHVGTDAFWRQVAQEGTPLVEPFGTNGVYQLVTFLWRATHETRNVLVMGSLTVSGIPRMGYVMHRLADTDVWYWTVKLPSGARFSYYLSPNDTLAGFDGPRADQRIATAQSDPLNPRRVDCGPDATRFECRSLAELSGAPPQPWLGKKIGTPEGKVEMRTIHSNIQKLDRKVAIYTPAGYTQNGTPNRLLVLFDGDEYLNQMGITVTLDNLIAAHKIPPTLVLLVFNPDGRRLKDLVANPEFADSMAKEIIPWVRREYNVTHDAVQTAVGGYSAGGLEANYMALRYSNIFGNVICQSGAVWWSPEQGIYDRDPSIEDNWIARQFAHEPKLPVRFYIEAGAFEFDNLGRGGNTLEASRELRDVLLAKGNEVYYHQFVGGHDGLTWPGTIADALTDLLSH